jgi:predicted transposase YbfD/YdcC
MIAMDILEYLSIVESFDTRQQSKVLHKLSEIIGISLFAMIANANEPEEIEIFCKAQESFLREYFELANGIPSHDTIERAFEMVSHEYLMGLQARFNELLNANEGDKIRKILAIDGKTQCGNASETQKANHIVSCVDEGGFCLGQELVDDKSNEITAIPELLDNLNIKGHIITTDAMGCQRDIVKKIRKKLADYVLALKGNQGTLFDDVKLYFDDTQFLSRCAYHKTTEKARGNIEIREYWQTDDISWLEQRRDWTGLKSIAMTKNTITKKGKTTTQIRYFISSLPLGAKEVARAIRKHWMVESYHWQLDVTFKEDANHTRNKHISYNLNIMRKLALNLLKLLDVGKKHVTLVKKRFMICCNPLKYFGQILSL